MDGAVGTATGFQRAMRLASRFYESVALSRQSRATPIRNANFDGVRLPIESEIGRKGFAVDLLADTRRCLTQAIEQLAAINAGAPIARPLLRKQAVNIVTEQIGLFESVLRQYDNENGDWRRAPAPTSVARPAVLASMRAAGARAMATTAKALTLISK